MRAAVEISMYPLAGDYRPLIQAFIDRLNLHRELSVHTNAVLAEEMGRAAVGPQLVFVLKVLPGLEPPVPEPPPAAVA
jgi:hypothetical protein